MNSTAEKLKSKNLKVTPQRISIYNILMKNNTHFSAESIHKILMKSHPTISLATVYKTLATFSKAGLAKEINIGENNFRYDAICTPHPHFICNKCKNIYDLPPLESINYFKKEITDITNFTISDEQIYLYGICSNCNNCLLENKKSL